MPAVILASDRAPAWPLSRLLGGPWTFTMELVDQLLVIADPNPGFAFRELMAAGYSEDEVRGAWNFARAAGYTESTGV